MNSAVPYLIQAIKEWILDNNCTPYLIVDATVEKVSVPVEYVEDGRIVLNISPRAVRGLVIDMEAVMFSGRFSGVAHDIVAPVSAVMGIVAKENGEGIWFPREEPSPDGQPPASSSDSSPLKGKPSLKLVR